MLNTFGSKKISYQSQCERFEVLLSTWLDFLMAIEKLKITGYLNVKLEAILQYVLYYYNHQYIMYST